MKKTVKFIITGVIALLAIAALVMVFVLQSPQNNVSAKKSLDNAETYMEKKEYEKAIKAYQEVIKLEPQNMTAYIGKADAFIALGGTGNADETLKQAISTIESVYKDKQTVLDNAHDVYIKYAKMLSDEDKIYDLLKRADSMIPGIFKEYFGIEYVASDDSLDVNAIDDGKAIMTEDGNVLFGWYPNKELLNDEITPEIKYAGYNEKGYARIGNCIYYKKVIDNNARYFMMDKITWQILEKTDTEYTLMTKQVIDDMSYNEKMESVTWDDSTLRKWLNSDFVDFSFSEISKKNLKDMDVKPSTNRYYWNTSGKDVMDIVTLIQVDSITDGVYGFKDVLDKESEARQTTATDYAIAKGVLTNNDGQCKYWLNTVGSSQDKAATVNYNGIINVDGIYVNDTCEGIRPVITLSIDAFN